MVDKRKNEWLSNLNTQWNTGIETGFSPPENFAPSTGVNFVKKLRTLIFSSKKYKEKTSKWENEWTLNCDCAKLLIISW